MHAANLHGVVVYTEGELTSQKICSRYTLAILWVQLSIMCGVNG